MRWNMTGDEGSAMAEANARAKADEQETEKEPGIMASEPHIIGRRFEDSGKRSKDECYSKTEWELFARICKNCGLPYGRHFGDYCPVEKKNAAR